MIFKEKKPNYLEADLIGPVSRRLDFYSITPIIGVFHTFKSGTAPPLVRLVLLEQASKIKPIHSKYHYHYAQ